MREHPRFHPHEATWPRIGQRVPGKIRMLKGARWFEVHPGHLIEVGWGDLSYTDLVRLQTSVSSVVAVILPEVQRAPMPRSLTGDGDRPTLDDILSEATIAVTADLGAVAISGSTTVLGRCLVQAASVPDAEDADAMLTEATAIAERLDDRDLSTRMHGVHAVVAYRAGRYDDAAACCERVIVAGTDSDPVLGARHILACVHQV